MKKNGTELEQAPKKRALTEREASVENTLSLISEKLKTAAEESDEALLSALPETHKLLHRLEDAVAALRGKRLSTIPPPHTTMADTTIPAPPPMPDGPDTDPPPPRTDRSPMLRTSHARTKDRRR